MAPTSLLWNVFAGFLLGWLSSTLVEWLWFRLQRSRVDLAALSANMAASPLLHDGSPPAQTDGEPDPLTEGRALSSDTQQDAQQDEGTDSAQTGHASRQAIANRPDDLTALHGIGDLYEQRLYQVGVFTWHQLSRIDAETLREITKALPSSNPRAWIEQAQALAMANDRVGAGYDGPLPDNLTRINGIDQVYEDELYAAGIFTFRQLAERAPDELAQIIPAHLTGDELNFASWISQADFLRDEYDPNEPPII